MRFIDPDHPFFRPAWRRVVTVAVILIWAAVEFLYGISLFGWLLLALGIYTLRALFAPRAVGTRAGDAPAPPAPPPPDGR